MNLVFWGREHAGGTTAHMVAVTGMLRALCGEECVVTGRFLREDTGKIAVSDCGTGFSGRRRHFLWHADLAVVNLRSKKESIARFFAEDFHVARRTMFLLEARDGEEGVDAEYLCRMYRIPSERAAVIPYNPAFAEALRRGAGERFIRKQHTEPVTFENEQFIRSVKRVADRMLRLAGEDFLLSRMRQNVKEQ